MEDVNFFFMLVEQMNACQDLGVEPMTCFQTMIEQLQEYVDKIEPQETI